LQIIARLLNDIAMANLTDERLKEMEEEMNRSVFKMFVPQVRTDRSSTLKTVPGMAWLETQSARFNKLQKALAKYG
jgi:hypothetical protein